MQVCLLQKEAYQRLTPKLKFAIHWLPSISGCDRQNATKGSICQFYFNPCLCKLGQKLVFTGSDRELTCYSSMSCWATLSNKKIPAEHCLSCIITNSLILLKYEKATLAHIVYVVTLLYLRFIKRFVSHLTQWSPLPSFKKKQNGNVEKNFKITVAHKSSKKYLILKLVDHFNNECSRILYVFSTSMCWNPCIWVKWKFNWVSYACQLERIVS